MAAPSTRTTRWTSRRYARADDAVGWNRSFGSTECAEFDGAVLPHANDSKDVVVFNYMLHHAADMTLSLLAHARRVARHHVVVVEDLKGESPNETMRQWEHEWHGTYRGADEWRAIFGLLGFTITKEVLNISPTCYTHKPPWKPTFNHPLTWPRAMFVMVKGPSK